ncbi:MAG: DUF1553 domain-containing protein [Planctomycetaceae bacterium]|nr:DUF1553 domain-containing protein [Planctomycetaceae bacterium]
MKVIRLRQLLSTVLILLTTSTGVSDERRQVSFSLDVKPILSDRCFACHGPSEESLQADLRLDLASGAEHVLVPGQPNESELYRRITTDDADERMPPADSKLSLSADEIDVIRRWIEQGAEYEGHWSFLPIRDVAVPEVEDAGWSQSPVDAFIWRRLMDRELSPAGEASRETLIRRVTFDLTGLPPTLDEIDAFLADKSPDAYEKLVDRLMASEHYGERMASEWLDVARYSDTYGYQVDRDRFVWPWRDWVIRAFNANVPYDEFITQQLAGDLLPDATDDQILATTFNRLHPQKVEGGSVPEEFRIEYVSDRTQTVATAFLGLTLECARCHDHKYDPIRQREYYELTAFFDNIDEAGLYSYFTPSVPTPTLALTDDATKDKLAQLTASVAQAESQLSDVTARARERFEEWLHGTREPKAESGDQKVTSTEEGDEAANPQPSTINHQPSIIPVRVKHLDFEDLKDTPNESVPGVIGKAVKLTGDDKVDVGVGNFPRHEPFSVALWMNTPDYKERAVVYHRSGAWTDAASRGYELLLEEGRLSAALIHFWPGNAIRVRTVEPIPLNQWLHVTVTYDGSSRADGLTIFVDGRPTKTEVIRDQLTKEIQGGGGDNIAIGERMRDRGFTNGLVDEFQVFHRQLTPIEIAQLYDGESLISLLKMPVGELTEGHTESLFAYYTSTIDAEYAAQLAALQESRMELTKLQNSLQEIMVMREMDEPRQTYFLKRGAYDARGEPVAAESPDAFPPFPDDSPANRLGLARWLTSDEHPLTARVTVNRYWQLVFGMGLVRTPEDFGSQGQIPTHPELLDWLARDFMTNGWDVKRLLKQLVMSATYRQSSSTSEAAVKRDPENRFWSHAASFRLPAEMLRDNALVASGLIVDRIGGAPAKPYEVEVSFKPTAPDTGEGLYRRSLYTYWKRTGPAPVMMTLDASKRDVCRVRRERTSSPLQAFVMMNSPQFVEASRVLSERLIRQHGENTDAALIDLFRLLTSRRPTDQELPVLRRLLTAQRERFTANPDQATALLTNGANQRDESLDAASVASLAVVANTLMNFDECVTRR